MISSYKAEIERPCRERGFHGDYGPEYEEFGCRSFGSLLHWPHFRRNGITAG
jgi:hypothetical protein